MNNEHADEHAIAGRKAQFLGAANRAAQTWFDAEGEWVAPGPPLYTRERFWLCFALYPNGSAALADTIIRGSKTAQTPEEFSIFDPNIACALLVNFRDQMAGDARQKLEELVRKAFSFYPGNRQPDFQFHGFNDNMPAKATLGLVLGGELLEEPEAVEYGLWNLRQLRAMMVRCGINSEFNSPTYAPLTIHALAEVAQHARSEEARELARGLEERLWLDLAARFHPETGVVAGPYARAYAIDQIAHASTVASLLWFHLGERARPSPMLLFDPPPGLMLHHMGDAPFNITIMSWLAAPDYHVPEAAWRMFERKDYPFRAIARCELGNEGPDWPARPARIETWGQSDYTLGTSSLPYGGGEQCAPYFVTYRRQEEVASFLDVGTVFSKIVVDDEVPGDLYTPMGGRVETAAQNTSGPLGENDLRSYAHTLTLQSEGTALVLTHPHLRFGGAADESEPLETQAARPLSALSELVIFSSHGGGADEIMVGGEPRAAWEGEVPRGAWIACRRGRLLIGVRPLVYGRDPESVPITLEKTNNYEVIRSTFYRGPQRTFSRADLRLMCGGFVAEHAGVDEFSSLGEFAAMLGETKFTDYYWFTRRTRYRRPASPRRAALDLEASWSSGSPVPRYATIDGRPIEWPVVQIDGLPETEIPFLSEPFRPVPAFFPWRDFNIVWCDLPYAIGDREE